MSRFTLALALIITTLGSNTYAMGEMKESEELINQEMCREYNHHFDDVSKECVYCAQHMKYNKATLQCEGQLSPLGKCFGNDHFHAETLECMYCAKDFVFNETTRKCESTQIYLAD